MQNHAITLRPLHAADIEDAMALSGAEGWNQTADDWTFILQHSKSSCVAAVSDGKLVGTATALHYANRVAWIGMVLVNQLYRGQGIGKLLLEHIFEETRFNASLKLDATAAGRQVYEKMGFRAEYQVARMVHASVKNISPVADNVLAQPVQEKDLPEIIAFDELVFGASRAALITWLVQQFPNKSWAIKQDDRVSAFALGRAGSRFHHIGPVVAQNDNEAVMLINKALQTVAGDGAIVDVLCDKKAFVDTLVNMGFTTQRYFTRMYRQDNPFPGTSSQQYAICGPEFG